ncbi:MAG: hypothetical protein KatS3mg113_0054 [Planctomycetaceae bacterium]|nr:MAG: hypothetical protein KatS3mg113_0054 [Planctomycetaceae bacterium]
MKSKHSLMLLGVATTCGLVAMVGVQQLMARQQAGKADQVMILVARQVIEPGVRLTPEMVAFKPFPRTHVPEGAIMQASQYEDRALKSRAYPGQVILQAQLGEKGQFGNSMEIPPGMRLVTLKVDPTMIHSGIMKPGDRVDVILTYQIPRRGGGRDTRTRTVLQYLQVYAMGAYTMKREPSEKETQALKDVKGVTLLVTPVQAQILKFAESKGDLHLTLRSSLDTEPVLVEGTDEEQLERLQRELSEEGEEHLKIASQQDTTEIPPAVPADTPSTLTDPSHGFETPPPSVGPKSVWKVEVYQGQECKVYEFETTAPAVRTAEEVTSAASEPWHHAWKQLSQWLIRSVAQERIAPSSSAVRLTANEATADTHP